MNFRIIVVVLFFYFDVVFSLSIATCNRKSHLRLLRRTHRIHGSSHFALTERQLQFWEDVDQGLDEIENFFLKKGEDISRIRQFSKSARGSIPPPSVSVYGHEPSEEHVEGLSAKPFWEAKEREDLFPWASELESNAHIILDEFDSVLKNSSKFVSDSAFQSQVMGEGWSAIRLQRLGVWNSDNCKQFPKTFDLLKSLDIPFAVRGVCFARQAPNSGVQPHSDGRNFILTSHLGLMIPTGCWIEVAGERRTWEVGKLITIDTSFSHSTGNPSTCDRYVLILDFWHPELTNAEQTALQFVYDLRNKYESGMIPKRELRNIEKSPSWWSLLSKNVKF